MEKEKTGQNRKKVEPNSDEWKLTEFKLQLSLGPTPVIVKNIYDISTTHVTSSFNNYSKGKTVLESFVDKERLPELNKIEKIYQKGF